MKHRRNDHFTALRGISDHADWLEDSSLGNRTYSQAPFLAMGQTGADADDGLAGKFLSVLPAHAATPTLDDFFTRAPTR